MDDLAMINTGTDGEYEVESHFAENQEIQSGERIFNVYINDLPVLPYLDLIHDHGFRKAIFRTYTATVENGESLMLHFEKITDMPVLSAINVTRRQSIQTPGQ